ncbi:MAG: pitrilysin family protein [Thermodesulfobacteriota bacterium]|nr:pitrilysin family protein [Thermodesulfobacteriota bacterium]
MGLQTTVLDNGIRIVTEGNPNVRSVSLGIWVKAGSRQDPSGSEGIAHFTEHVMFKGTKRRTALQIAKEIDALGGILNAHTAKEHSAYYIKVLDEHLEKAIDVLSDIFLNSEFKPEEIEKEKNVVLQEIRMTEDTPDDYVAELFSMTFFHNTPLGVSILGSPPTVKGFTRDHVISFIDQAYSPNAIVIAGAGNLDHARVVDLLRSRFESYNRAHNHNRELTTPPMGGGCLARHKDLEQVHITLGTAGPMVTDNKRWAYVVLNTVLGGGMSSMLFQEAREKLGIVYSIYSYLSAYEDCGVLAVYAGTSDDHVSQTIEVIGAQARRLKQGDFAGLKLDDVREQIKGHLLLARESTESRMATLAKNVIYYGRDVPIDEVIEKINSVRAQDLVELAEEIFVEDNMTLVALGKVEDSQLKGCLAL